MGLHESDARAIGRQIFSLRLLLRYFGSGLAGFGEADGDGLLAALHLLAAPAGLKRAVFVLAHDLGDFLLGLGAALFLFRHTV